MGMISGIALLIIAIAFAVLVIFLARVLSNLTKTLNGVNETVDKLPEQLDQVMNQSELILHNSNETILDVNEKLHSLSPLFYIVGDAGEASRKLTSSLVDMTAGMKRSSTEGKGKVNEQALGGLYGSLALGYYMYQKRQAIKDWKEENTGNA